MGSSNAGAPRAATQLRNKLHGKPAGVRKAMKAATQAKILAAAKALFEGDGYEAVTLRDIAHVAGMSTGAVFNSWSGKAELYRAIYGHDPITPEQGRELLAALNGGPVPAWASAMCDRRAA